MLPRFRFGKLIIVSVALFCLIFYIKSFNTYRSNENIKYKWKNHNHGELTANNLIPNHFIEENEIQMQEPLNPTTESPYEFEIRNDLKKQRPGLGNEGRAVFLKGFEKEQGEEKYKKIALNEELSEHLSYNRTTPDSRNPLCKKIKYDVSALPTASVVIIFFNEPYSVLVRTVHSVINTCDKRILKQIILVDDGSSNIELGEKLDYYISTRIPEGIVHILRLKNRMGLIRARLAGARAATGDVLIFLDAHCEANIGWTEPLLERIKKSRTTVVIPIIDVIDAKDFQYSTNGYKTFQVGGFHWNGHFDWINVQQSEKDRQKRECKVPIEICPTFSPTMAGGLFAIDRQYFWEIGSYDEQMDGWGGENLEMSFRIWQCGGTIETIPCSRVGHVFRDFHPYNFPNDRDTHGINTARMALTWMDDYVELFFLYRPDLKFHSEIGDITHRVMLRAKLRCKNFDWYLRNIYPDKFIPTKNVQAYGKIRNPIQNLCLDDLQQNNENPYNLGLYFCSKTVTKSQFYSLTNNGILRNELSCATAQKSKILPLRVVMTPCLEKDDYNEKFEYINEHLIHLNTELCLDSKGLKNMNTIKITQCDENSETQKWIFEKD